MSTLNTQEPSDLKSRQDCEGTRLDQYMSGEIDYLETDDSLYKDPIDPVPNKRFVYPREQDPPIASFDSDELFEKES